MKKPLNSIVFRMFFRLTLFSCIVFMTSSCATVLKLPDTTPDMKTVYLIKYSSWGHHSLAFYSNGFLTEYTFGDWALYALNKRDSWTAWKNMTFFTQGALGRKQTKWNQQERFCDKFTGCEQAVSFLAPTTKVLELQDRLQRSYEEKLDTQVYNRKEEVYFVQYDVQYWGFHNCNHELVDWLEILGAEVSGKVFYNPDFIGGIIGEPILLQ